MKLGFIGLGNLGSPIAENLLKNTQQLFVYNRSKEKSKPLVEKGAVACTSVSEIASLCDIVFSAVSNDAALKEITDGKDGIAAHLKEGGIHVSVSTILPATAGELYALHGKYKNHYLASPVMGRPEAARAGKLNFLVSGNKAAIEQAKPFLLKAGGSGVWEFGDEPGAANVAKLCSNMLIMTAVEAMAEGIQLAAKSGVDPVVWMNMLTQTLFNAPVYINYSNILLNEQFLPPGFSLRLALKDVNLVIEQAATVHAKMPVGKTVQQQFMNSMENGHAEYDMTAVALQLK
jgi:3-hydroxyisobutyrate dehydrogenase-like beta-hydroxyacid dehydrogenase